MPMTNRQRLMVALSECVESASCETQRKLLDALEAYNESISSYSRRRRAPLLRDLLDAIQDGCMYAAMERDEERRKLTKEESINV